MVNLISLLILQSFDCDSRCINSLCLTQSEWLMVLCLSLGLFESRLDQGWGLGFVKLQQLKLFELVLVILGFDLTFLNYLCTLYHLSWCKLLLLDLRTTFKLLE